MSNLSNTTLQIVEYMMKDTTRIAADGSYKDRRSAYCTILESRDMQHQIIITGADSENHDEDD